MEWGRDMQKHRKVESVRRVESLLPKMFSRNIGSLLTLTSSKIMSNHLASVVFAAQENASHWNAIREIFFHGGTATEPR